MLQFDNLLMQLKIKLRHLLASSKIRYLVIGAWNTAFGYVISVFLYFALSPKLHLIAIGIIANIIAITMSFSTYKVFVFKTKGQWLREYFRSYIVYGGMAFIGTALLWLLVDGLAIPFWLAQGIVIFVTVMISYFSHKNFTFRQNSK